LKQTIRTDQTIPPKPRQNKTKHNIEQNTTQGTESCC